ncbi:DDB1- and CUL4-associated factor 6 [Nymphon striatum]|nr:DDB1- and CUL4-associated factor 6 [Nymphon striatum]KAG1666277.1 DDB1- and CUL4-associated factor 6 [Nymphon striatum]
MHSVLCVAEILRSAMMVVMTLTLMQKRTKTPNNPVNTICWNETGEYILSGSDDIHLCISNAHTLKKRTLIKSAHRNNIFSAKFLPCCNDRKIISCSGDGIIAFTNLDTPFMADTNTFNCHLGTTYELSIVPNDPFSFLSCGEDKTVRLFDLRTKTGCSRHDCSEDILINCHKAVTAMCVNPALPYQLAVGCSDSTIRIYDRRMIGTPASGYSTSEYTKGLLTCSSVSFAENRKHRITSLCYNKTGDELLVSYSAENIYLFKLKDERFITYNTVEQEISSPDQSQPSSASAPPPIKKLRVRGDWSDTGPSARPESEIETIPEDPQINRPFRSAVIDRMSDVLNRMLNDPARSLNQNTSQELDSQETVENREATNVNNSDEQASSAPCQPSTSFHIQISQPTTDVQSSSDSDKVARNDVENQCQPEELLEESSQSQ